MKRNECKRRQSINGCDIFVESLYKCNNIKKSINGCDIFVESLYKYNNNNKSINGCQ